MSLRQKNKLGLSFDNLSFAFLWVHTLLVTLIWKWQLSYYYHYYYFRTLQVVKNVVQQTYASLRNKTICWTSFPSSTGYKNLFKNCFIVSYLLISELKKGKLLFLNLFVLHLNSLTILHLFLVLMFISLNEKRGFLLLRFLKANFLQIFIRRSTSVRAENVLQATW